MSVHTSKIINIILNPKYSQLYVKFDSSESHIFDLAKVPHTSHFYSYVSFTYYIVQRSQNLITIVLQYYKTAKKQQELGNILEYHLSCAFFGITCTLCCNWYKLMTFVSSEHIFNQKHFQISQFNENILCIEEIF